MAICDFKEYFLAGDGEAFAADMAPGFAFYHAAHPQPTTDVRFLKLALEAARDAMGPDFEWTHEFHGDVYGALRWTATIGGQEAEGVDLIKEAPDGKLLEVRITMRPAEAVAVWQQEMFARLQELLPDS